MAHTKLFQLTQIFFLICISIVNANWGVPGDGQYHIQTDEGPERYFRYQTDSGQYRKEKRLSDGTVIGTDAWIDALGFLRQNDYIADNEGYRLLKSKTVYVGKGRPIQEAIKAAKKQSAKAGTVVKQSGSTLTTPKKSITKHHSKTTTTTVLPIQSITDNPLGYDHYKTPLIVDIHPHSQPHDSNYLPPLSDDQYLTTTVRPSLYTTPSSISSSSQSSIPPYLPPKNQYLNDESQYTQQYPLPANVNRPPFSDPNSNNPYAPIALYPPSSTPAPPTADYGPPIALYPSSTPKPDYLDYGSSTTGRPNYPNNPFINQINNEFGSSAPGSPFSSSPYHRYGYQSATTPLPPPTPPQQNQQHYQSHYNHRNQYIPPQVSPSTIRPYLDANNDINNNNNNGIQPLFNRNAYQSPQFNGGFPQQYYGNNQIGNGYDQQFPLYDGVSATANGFRYFLPRQYHEEDNTDPNRRAGSFGYIDPFGIRRVTYYNTSPEGGFVHRKNNRYVGFNATPYDPRPL